MIRNITLVLSCDKEYIIPAYVTLYSLLCNYKGSENIETYVLTRDKNNLEEYFELFNELETKFSFLHLSFISVGRCFNKVKISAVINNSIATMYRLLIPNLVKADKCIYLDTDLVVEGDISALYNIDLGEFCIAGVKDYCLSNNKGHAKVLGIPTIKNYINAGVLVFNNERINKLGLNNVITQYGETESFPYHDQDIINKALFGEIKIISLCYNVISVIINRKNRDVIRTYGKEDVYQAESLPVIYHYAGSRKPWVFKHMYGANRWWKYIDKQDEEVLKTYIIPFLQSYSISPFDEVKERIESMIKSVGLYPVFKKIEIIIGSASHQICCMFRH